MRYLFLLFSFCLFISTVHAQSNGSNTVSVTAQGEVELPADIIQFNINLNAEGDTPQEAYNLHKKREKVLVRLLQKYEIKEENIRFQPLSISKRYEEDYSTGKRDRKEIFNTSQQVSLQLKDFDIYEKIQVTLIEHDFDQFNGTFLSTEQKQGEDEALRKALQKARQKAEIIAEESDITLGTVHNINYHESQFYPGRQRETMAMSPDSQSLMQYQQTVVLQASVTIQFLIMH